MSRMDDRTARRWPVMLLAATLLLGACAGDADDDADVDVQAGQSLEGDDAPEEPDEPEEPEEPAEPEEPEEPEEPVSLDVVERHPGGVVLELVELRVEATAVELDVRVTNGQSTFANLDANTSSRLVDDLGNEYPLVSPDGNRNVTVPAGEVLEGTLAFSGPVPQEATSVVFEVNTYLAEDDDRADVDQDEPTTSPYFLVEDIPLVADDATDTADDEDSDEDFEGGDL